MVKFFFEGLIIGFVIAVPVGPIGLLCINRALSGGTAYGLLSGLGVATADSISSAIAVLGLTLVSSFLMSQQVWLRPLVGVFLCVVGLRTFLTRPIEPSASITVHSLAAAYGSTFFLNFTSPVTILSFLAIYTGWGVESLRGNYLAAATLAMGVFCGSALWWFLLTGGLLLFREKFTYRGLRWVHRISGMIIAAFGFIVLLSLLING